MAAVAAQEQREMLIPHLLALWPRFHRFPEHPL